MGKPVAPKWIVAAFLAKVIAGFAYGYVYANYFPVSDSWVYFEESIKEYHVLLNSPADFFSTGLQFHDPGNFFSTADNAAWSNAGENILIKLLAIFNLLSGGNYYIDVILFNSFSFFGLYLICLVAFHFFERNKLPVFCLIFFLPSCLFWNSGVDKDGLMLCCTGILIYALFNCWYKSVTWGRVAAAVFFFAFLFLLRNATALLLLPALLGWWMAIRLTSRKAYLPFIIIYATCVVCFFLTVYLSPDFNLPLKVAEKQHQFLALEANTVLPLTPLQPALKSYLEVLPQALNHIFLRPYITEIKSPFHLMAFVEVLLIVITILIAFVSDKRKVFASLKLPFSLFLLLLALSGFLLIGYTVPFTGAIVRYKALYTVFFLLPFAGTLKCNGTGR